MTEQGTALQHRTDAALAEFEPSRMQSAMAELQGMRLFIRDEMREGLDFGKVPGTGPKPTMLQPGAQKVVMYYNCRPEYHVDTREMGEGHVEHIVTADLIQRATREVVGQGLGSCTTMESKYRFRMGSRICPACNSDALRKGKGDRGGWYCWAKIGGCGATFGDNDPAIVNQPVGRVENDNIWDVRNTVLKLAKKRALVDAAVGMACLAEFFTQDLDDFAPDGAPHVEAPPQPTRRPSATRASQQQQQSSAGQPAQTTESAPSTDRQTLYLRLTDALSELDAHTQDDWKAWLLRGMAAQRIKLPRGFNADNPRLELLPPSDWQSLLDWIEGQLAQVMQGDEAESESVPDRLPF